MINGHDLRLTGIIERDPQEGSVAAESKSSQTNGNDSITIPTSRQQEPGVIRYTFNDTESTVPFSPSNVTNAAALYCGDKVSRRASISSRTTIRCVYSPSD